MSRILSKKVNRTPVRSPSPDIASRNIIGRTASPLTEAMSKLRMSKSSVSPFGRGFSSTEQYEAHINTLQGKIKLLNKENEILQHENVNKSKQIQFLKEMNFKYRKEVYAKNDSHLQYRPDILPQYQTKIKDLSMQVARIHDLLTKDQSTISRLEKQNDDLRNQVASTRNSRVPQMDQRKLNKQLADIEYTLKSEFRRRENQYQNKVEMVLQEEIRKMGKIQRDQKQILKLLQKQKSYASPIKNGRQRELMTSTSNKSPSSNEVNKQRQARPTSRYFECQNCKKSLLRIAQLQAELNVKAFSSRHASKSSVEKHNVPASHLIDYLEKLEEIKIILANEQVEESINHIESNLNDIFSIKEKFEYMKEQKNIIIQQLRQKEVEQSLEIVKLKKQNQLFKVQVEEQNEEIQKLKEMIDTSLTQSRKVEPITKRKNAPNDANILRKYIVEAIQRIEDLQSQIGDTLRS